MPTYPCDFCGREQATTSVNDMVDPQNTKFVGPECLPIMGMTFVIAMEPVELDAALKVIGYAPTKATKEARKASELPEVDGNRTIAEVVESAPREDDPPDPPTRIDSATSQQNDLSTIGADGEEVESVLAVGEAYDAATAEQRADDPDDPAPY